MSHAMIATAKSDNIVTPCIGLGKLNRRFRAISTRRTTKLQHKIFREKWQQRLSKRIFDRRSDIERVQWQTTF